MTHTTDPDLWDRFRAIHGPRPAGRTAQACWEKEWEDFQAEAKMAEIEKEMETAERLTAEAESRKNPTFLPGQRVTKSLGDYTFEGAIVAAFCKRSGAVRYVIEDDQGLLLILSAQQLEPVHA